MERAWNPRIEAVSKGLESWKIRSLSYGGRALVVNAPALSRICYVASLVHMFVFCCAHLFDSVMIIFSVEFVVHCFEVRCFFLCVCVVFTAFTWFKTALGA